MGWRESDRICTETYNVRVLYPRNNRVQFARFKETLTHLRLLKNLKVLRTTRSSHVCFVEVYKIRTQTRHNQKGEYLPRGVYHEAILPLKQYHLIDSDTRDLHQNGKELKFTWEEALKKYHLT